MSNTNNSQNIIESLEKVEHPAIATTLYRSNFRQKSDVNDGLTLSQYPRQRA